MYDFKTFKFGAGAHTSRDKGMCVMEAVAYVAGEEHSDSPVCACPVISAFLRSWNDNLPSDSERNRLLAGFVFRLPGTKATGDVENKRGMMALEWLIKEFTPAMFDLVPSLAEHAKAIRSLKINRRHEAKILAVLSAAESAAESAARSAARSAAESAARSAAWSAAESAAWSAAESAARSAAESAARSAARSAAWSAMQPTVDKLQKSAIRLLNRMIRLTEPREKVPKCREKVAVSDK